MIVSGNQALFQARDKQGDWKFALRTRALHQSQYVDGKTICSLHAKTIKYSKGIWSLLHYVRDSTPWPVTTNGSLEQNVRK